jgi:hypothetical protein
MIEEYLNTNGDEMVALTNADGSVTSMTKAFYDEQQAKVSEAKTK